MHLYVYVQNMCAGVRGVVYPGTGVTGDGELLIWVLGTKLRSSGRDVVLLTTEPALQLFCHIINKNYYT